MIDDAAERVVLESECHELTGLARSTRFQLEKLGKFPRRRQLARSDRRIGWLFSELVEWMHGLPTGPAPATPPESEPVSQ